MKHPVFTIDQIWHVEIGTEIKRFESYSEAFKAYSQLAPVDLTDKSQSSPDQ